MEKARMQLVETVFPIFQDPILGSEAGEVICEIRKTRILPASAPGCLHGPLKRIAVDQVHLINGDTQYNQRLARLGSPSI